MSSSPRNKSDDDRGAKDALLGQLRGQSAEALGYAERWFNGDADAAPALRQSLEQLQSVSGMVGLDGIATLAGAAAAVTDTGNDAAKEALAEGLVALNAHLEALRPGESAPVTRYLDDINRLHVAAGIAPLDDEATFVARLASAAPHQPPAPLPRTGGPTFQALAQKLREPAARIFTALRRENASDAVFDAMAKLVATLERGATDASARAPWWLASLLLAHRRDGSIPADGLRALLLGLEALLECAAEGRAADEQWVYRAVYRLRSVPEVRAAYAADDEPRDTAQVNDARGALRSAALVELARVRDVYDIYLRSGAADATVLGPAAQRLATVISPLQVAGLVRASDLLEDARIALAALAAGQPLGPTANLIADTLLHAEQLLDSGGDGPAEKLHREALAGLIDGALEDLREVHQAIVAAIEMDDPDGLSSGPERLEVIAGAMAVAGLAEVGEITRECAAAMRQAPSGGPGLDALAEALVCLELQLGALREGSDGNADLMARARGVLAGGSDDVADDAAPADVDEPPVVDPTADPDLVGVFIEEAGEQLGMVVPEFLSLRAQPDDAGRRVAVQRFFHTLKGSGRMVGAARIAEFSGVFEHLMIGLEESGSPLGASTLDLLGAAIAAVTQLHEQLESGAEPTIVMRDLRAAATASPKAQKVATKQVLAACARSAAAVVRRWLDAVRDGKGSGRVPTAVPDALARLLAAAQLVGDESAASLATALRDRVDTLVEVDATVAQDLTSELERMLDVVATVAASGQLDEAAVDAYREEGRGLLERIGEAIECLLVDAADSDAVAAMQRDLHTLKGASRVAGFLPLSDVVHELESIVQAVAHENLVVTPRLLWMLQRVLDAMFGLLDVKSATVAAARAQASLQELRGLAGDADNRAPLPIGSDRRRKPRVSIESERVRSDQLDRALVRALSLALRASQLGTEADEAIKGLVADAQAIRDALIRTRLAPLHLHATRWRRAVRQVAEDNGREVELRFEGAETELDRRLLDGLTAPLEHLLRNAVVHGIESPFARRAAGKSGTGNITIRASLDVDGVVVEVEDDGVGIDPEKIRSVARERGIAVPDGRLSPAQVLLLLATPGFSTAPQLTQSAGYGIGLDSVLAAVKESGGGMQLQSTPGSGSRFTLTIPTPTPVIAVELFAIGSTVLAVPPGAVFGVRAADPLAAAAEHQGEKWPWLDVGATIGVIGATPGADAGMAVLLRHGGRGVAVRVDAALGKIDAAVHRLRPGELTGSHCIAGVGLLDGGRLATVLNVEAAIAGCDNALRLRPMALVVDDSPTARDETVRKLEKAGWRTVVASDSAEARALLGELRPQLAVLDIDMPDESGLELLSWMRGQHALATTPVIMASAALDDARRKQASELGAQACLDKPFSGSAFEDALSALAQSG